MFVLTQSQPCDTWFFCSTLRELAASNLCQLLFCRSITWIRWRNAYRDLWIMTIGDGYLSIELSGFITQQWHIADDMALFNSLSGYENTAIVYIRLQLGHYPCVSTYQLVFPKPLTRPFVLQYVKLLGFANQASLPPLQAPRGVTNEWTRFVFPSGLPAVM